MKSRKDDEKFSDDETQRRFEAALRGARVTGHKPMSEISPKLTKLRKRKKKPSK